MAPTEEVLFFHNSEGKSNILDAISFVLFLKHISKKHKHFSELIYREEHENYRDNHREMFVQLNFKDGNPTFSLKRMINSQGIQEYFFNGQPLVAEEYLGKIREHHLNINNFCAYQGKLEDLCFKQESQSLVQTFEELSGSFQMKPQCEELKAKVASLDEKIKHENEVLHHLRLERVKLKGLQEFVDQMKDCLQQQKLVEDQLKLSEILLAKKSMDQSTSSLEEYQKGLDDTVASKQSVLQEMRKIELELKKLQNTEESLAKSIKAKKEELMVSQGSAFNKQKAIDQTKEMIVQKKAMLNKIAKESRDVVERRANLLEVIQGCRERLEALEKEKSQNMDLQMQDSLRDEYLQIKSKLEQENA